ncbi:DUF397 domain-containing protein [Streptomyces sp. NPDC087845]|uniref:DUF397 domain-containing protein n=1 Tax=Streptomyces sp. NPDC087845 TaxID=3365806 RepID=UPI003800B996
MHPPPDRRPRGHGLPDSAADLAAPHGIVPVRDSKNPGGPVLHTSPASFASFVAGVKAGEVGAI